MIYTNGSYHNEQRLRISYLAKVFTAGRSQAVRLPKELRFSGKEVIAKRFGNGVLLLPREGGFRLLQEAMDEFEPGFRIERVQPAQQRREGLA